MTEDHARVLCARRRAEQPQLEWVVQPRAAAEWVVVSLPRIPRIDAATVRAGRGAPVELADDPRPANWRNVPPLGGGN